MDRRLIRFRSILLRLYRNPWMVVLLGLLATSVLFWEVRRAELNDFRAKFETSTTARATRVIREMEESLSVMRALAQFVQRTKDLNGKDFRNMVTPFLTARGDIESVGWVPVAGTVEEAGPPIQTFGALTANGSHPVNQPGLSTSRRGTYSVLYSEPAPLTTDTVGFDLGSDPDLRTALERARDTGTSVATAWLKAGSENKHFAILLILPIYERGLVPDRIEERRTSLRGFVLGLLHIDRVLADLFATTQPEGLSIEFLDFHDGTQGRTLYERAISRQGKKGSWASVLLPEHPPFLFRAFFAGREWGIKTTPGDAYLRKYHGLGHWFILPVGLVLTLLAALYRRSFLMQWARMERAIAERTAKLLEHERNLEELVKERTESLSWKTAFLEAVTDASRDGIVVIDSQGKETFRNGQATRLWKTPSPLRESTDGPLETTSFLDLVKGPPQFKKEVISISKRTNACLRQEIEFLDGTILDTYSSPVSGKDNTYYGRIWMFHDITERKEAEEALRRSEATLRSVVSASPVGIALVTVDRNVMWVSEAMYAITGYAHDSLDTDDTNPRRLYDTEEEFARVCTAIYGDRPAGTTGMIDTRWLRKDGTVIDVSLGAVPVDPENPSSDMVIAAIDITDRKRAEETLRDSENKFRDLAEKSVLGISLVQDGYYRFVNGRFAEITVWLSMR